MSIERKQRVLRTTLVTGMMGGLALLSADGLQASTLLWSNGATITTFSGDNRCDSGPNACGSAAAWTVFDNFNVPGSSTGWLVSGFDFTDFLVNGSTSDYQSTNWSIFTGDPLNGGKLVASGTVTASLSNLGGSCGNGSTCVEEFTVTLGAVVALLPGNTYYLGTSNVLTMTNAGESTLRAFAAGGNTAPAGTANPLQRWEESNGSTTGVVGSSWNPGGTNVTFPGPLGINETATAFDIQGTMQGTTAALEPATWTLVGIALAGLCLRRRPRTA